MPIKKKVEASALQQNDFMKFYMMQSELHEDDREKATAIVKNMYPPPWQTKEGRALKRNPFFASSMEKEENVNLHVQDLLKLQQIACKKVPKIKYIFKKSEE